MTTPTTRPNTGILVMESAPLRTSLEALGIFVCGSGFLFILVYMEVSYQYGRWPALAAALLIFAWAIVGWLYTLLCPPSSVCTWQQYLLELVCSPFIAMGNGLHRGLEAGGKLLDRKHRG